MHKCIMKSFCFVISLLILRGLIAASMGMWSAGYNEQVGQWAFVMAGVFGHFGASAIEYVFELIARDVNSASAERATQEHALF